MGFCGNKEEQGSENDVCESGDWLNAPKSQVFSARIFRNHAPEELLALQGEKNGIPVPCLGHHCGRTSVQRGNEDRLFFSKTGEESYTWKWTKKEQMRDLMRNQSVRMRWVKRLNAWTWESLSSRLYATRRELLMRMGGVGTSNIRACGVNSSTRLMRTDLDFVAPRCVTT